MSILRPTSRSGKAIRNMVLWFLSIALLIFCVWWFFGDAIAGLRQSSGSKAFPRSENLGTTVMPTRLTVYGIEKASWYVAAIAGIAGIIQLWKKSQYTWRGWICVSICAHILIPHFTVSSIRFFSEVAFGGLWNWLDLSVTVLIYAWWTAIFFCDSAFNTKVVPTDKIGVFVLWERRLSWGNKIPSGPVALPCPKWLGLKVENESSKTETVTLETAPEKPVVIQAGSAIGKPFAVHLKATFKFRVVDPIMVKTTPLDEKLRREAITQALTEELQNSTDIKDVRKNKSAIAAKAVLNPHNTKSAGTRFASSGYELLSIDITSAERDPKLEAAEIKREEQIIEEQIEDIDQEGLIRQTKKLMDELGITVDNALTRTQTQRDKIKRTRLDGLNSGGSGKGGKGKNKQNPRTGIILPPP